MWLIIGYGNRLRGDDSAGPRLAERLSDQWSKEQISVISGHQLTPELALELAAPEVEGVLFLDAKQNQTTACVISQLNPDGTGSCGHQLSPQQLLQLARKLYGHAVPGWLLTIAGEQFSFCEQLSPACEYNSTLAFQQAVNFINSTPNKLGTLSLLSKTQLIHRTICSD